MQYCGACDRFIRNHSEYIDMYLYSFAQYYIRRAKKVALGVRMCSVWGLRLKNLMTLYFLRCGDRKTIFIFIFVRSNIGAFFSW